MPKPSLSVIVPAYNEEANLARTVLAAEAKFRALAAESLEWILVDDGSSDGTWSEILNLADSMPGVISVKHSVNKGLGAAIWTGIAQASLAWCTWMPADGQFKPQAFADMFHLVDESDLVILMRDEDRRSWWRRIPSRVVLGSMLIGMDLDLYGYSGIFMVRRHIVQAVPLYCTTGVQNFAVVLHSQRGRYHIQRMHTVIQPRLSGKSKVANLPTMLKTLFEIVRFRFCLSFSAGSRSSQVEKST